MLNKRKRFEIYKECLKIFEENLESDKTHDMCFCIQLSILAWGTYKSSPIIDDPTKEFPELKLYEPENHDLGWFSYGKRGLKERISILKKILK